MASKEYLCICKENDNLCLNPRNSDVLFCDKHMSCDIFSHMVTYYDNEIPIARKQIKQWCDQVGCNEEYKTFGKTYIYPGGSNCPHCYWVSNIRTKKIKPRIFAVYPQSVCFIADTHFINCLSVILRKHISTDVHLMFKELINAYMNLDKFNIYDVVLTINSPKKKMFGGEKEHLHGFIVMNSLESQNNFNKYLSKNPTGNTTVPTKPYDTDQYVTFEPDDIKQLLEEKSNTFYERMIDIIGFNEIDETTDIYYMLYMSKHSYIKMFVSFGLKFPKT